jgi:hypothetical protein
MLFLGRYILGVDRRSMHHGPEGELWSEGVTLRSVDPPLPEGI